MDYAGKIFLYTKIRQKYRVKGGININHKIGTELVNGRVRSDLAFILARLVKETGMTKSSLLELAIVALVPKFTPDFKYQGIDLKELSEYIHAEKIRNMTKIKRNEFMSQALLRPRIRSDLSKIVRCHRHDPALNDLITGYLAIVDQEITHYRDPTVAQETITDIKDQIAMELDSIKAFIDSQSDTPQLPQKVTKHG